jgi:hypothetical protein
MFHCCRIHHISLERLARDKTLVFYKLTAIKGFIRLAPVNLLADSSTKIIKEKLSIKRTKPGPDFLL